MSKPLLGAKDNPSDKLTHGQYQTDETQAIQIKSNQSLKDGSIIDLSDKKFNNIKMTINIIIK